MSSRVAFLVVVCSTLMAGALRGDEPKKVRLFILSGQWNKEG